jgi:hypothetical protein
MAKVSPFPTSKENIALALIFHWLGEERCNRTYDEYRRIAKRLPKLEALHAYVNQKLGEFERAGYAPYQICYFRSKDRHIRYEDFPTSLSRETVRSALVKIGMWQLRTA